MLEKKKKEWTNFIINCFKLHAVIWEVWQFTGFYIFIKNKKKNVKRGKFFLSDFFKIINGVEVFKLS